MSKSKKKKRGIRFSRDGSPARSFNNDQRILNQCAMKAGLLKAKGSTISPYVVTTCLARHLEVELPGENRRENFEWFVGWLIEKYQIKAPAKSPQKKPCSPRKTAPTAYESFYKSWDWRRLRMKVLKARGVRCECCGANRGDITIGGEPVRIVVDHIKPIRLFWHLRLDQSNLQILCDECNMGKGSWDQTDWRNDENTDQFGGEKPLSEIEIQLGESLINRQIW